MSNSDFSNKAYKQCIALSGMIQAVTLVDQLANTGKVSEEAFNTSIGSILVIDSASIEEVFQGQVNFIPGLSVGFKQLHDLLENKNPTATPIFRYAIGLLHLQKKLMRNKALLSVLSSRLEQSKEKLEHFDITHERMIGNLAQIYEDTLSTFRYRIQVTGNRLYLENPQNIHKIRALLLAGVRSAMLWRQMGGKRWDLLLNRKSMISVTNSLM